MEFRRREKNINDQQRAITQEINDLANERIDIFKILDSEPDGLIDGYDPNERIDLFPEN